MKVRTLLIFFLLIIIAGCQTNSPQALEEEEQVEPIKSNEIESEQEVEQESKDEGDVKEQPTGVAQEETDGQANVGHEEMVRIGVEGYEEDILVQAYQNQWLTMMIDSSLEVKEHDSFIRITHSNLDVEFTIEVMTTSLAQEEQDKLFSNMEGDLLTSGFEWINEFPVQTTTVNGFGSIYYSLEDRVSIDVYYLESSGMDHALFVQFRIPEELMESYTPRFEYMLETIELLSM